MVKKDLSHLDVVRSQSYAPVAQPEFVSAVANAWYDDYIQQGNAHRSTAIADLPYRASNTALRCDRQLYFAMSGAERPLPNLADAYRMSLGTLVHAGLEPAIKRAFKNADFEVPVDLRPIGVPGSAHADIVTYHDDGRCDAVVEVKTVNGFGFKSMATDFKGPAQGPRSGHVLQAALSALALGADRVVIAYLAMENLSPSMSKYVEGDLGRFAAEWHYTREEYTALAQAEIERINNVVAYLEFDTAPAPWVHDAEVPAMSYISDPMKGTWVTIDPKNPNTIVDTGRVWFCDYCDFRDKCMALQNQTPVEQNNPF